jgi:hypothetical protein
MAALKKIGEVGRILDRSIDCRELKTSEADRDSTPRAASDAERRVEEVSGLVAKRGV